MGYFDRTARERDTTDAVDPGFARLERALVLDAFGIRPDEPKQKPTSILWV